MKQQDSTLLCMKLRNVYGVCIIWLCCVFELWTHTHDQYLPKNKAHYVLWLRVSCEWLLLYFILASKHELVVKFNSVLPFQSTVTFAELAFGIFPHGLMSNFPEERALLLHLISIFSFKPECSIIPSTHSSMSSVIGQSYPIFWLFSFMVHLESLRISLFVLGISFHGYLVFEFFLAVLCEPSSYKEVTYCFIFLSTW